MPLRIAFDLDGVLADMEGELARHAERLFGDRVARRSEAVGPGASEPVDTSSDAVKTPASSPDTEPPLPKLELTSKQQRRLWHHVQAIGEFWETLPEVEPGAVTRLATLAADRRWEVIFVTKRPESVGATAQVQTQRWLESKGFALPSVFVVQGSRGRIAAALGLDIVVDDRAENCLDVVTDSRARAVLVWRDDEKLLPAAARRLGIGVVFSVAECFEVLAEIDSETHERAGMMERVKRALGLKSEPAC